MIGVVEVGLLLSMAASIPEKSAGLYILEVSTVALLGIYTKLTSFQVLYIIQAFHEIILLRYTRQPHDSSASLRTCTGVFCSPNFGILDQIS